MMLMALFSLYTSWCWKKLRLILSFIIDNHHVLKRGKVRGKLVGAKCPFPFHRFPVVWERCHINQSLDSFDLRDQQSLSPTWSRIRWQFVKRCGLRTAEGFAILIVLTISQAFDQPAICVLLLLFFQENCHHDHWSFQSKGPPHNICNELFKIFLFKALLLSNMYKCYSDPRTIWHRGQFDA